MLNHRIDLTDLPKTNSASRLDTKEISLNQSLDSYKKALHTIVKKLNRSTSTEKMAKSRRANEKAVNQSYNQHFNNTSTTNKSPSNSNILADVTNQESKHKRTHSGSGDRYKPKCSSQSVYESFLNNSNSTSKLNKSINTSKYVVKTENYDDKENIDYSRIFKKESQSQLNNSILNTGDVSTIETECDEKLKEMIHKYQLRDAMHRQEIAKLKKANDLYKGQMKNMQDEMEKVYKNRDLECKYITKLESELHALREKEKKRAAEKSYMSPKENMKYIKIIEELNRKIINMSNEKKLVEDLLKNSLLQNEIAKKKQQATSQQRTALASIDLNIPNPPKSSNRKDNSNRKEHSGSFTHETANFTTQPSSQTQSQRMSTNSGNYAQTLPEEENFNMTQTYFYNQANKSQLLTPGHMAEVPECDEESERYLSNRVTPPPESMPTGSSSGSHKEKFDMSQLRLDLSQVIRNRK